MRPRPRPTRRRNATKRRELQLFFDVKNAFYEYVYLAGATRIARENLELMRHFEEVARAKYRYGGRHPSGYHSGADRGGRAGERAGDARNGSGILPSPGSMPCSIVRRTRRCRGRARSRAAGESGPAMPVGDAQGAQSGAPEPWGSTSSGSAGKWPGQAELLSGYRLGGRMDEDDGRLDASGDDDDVRLGWS